MDQQLRTSAKPATRGNPSIRRIANRFPSWRRTKEKFPCLISVIASVT